MTIPTRKIYSQITEIINKYQRFCIASHENPDGDCIGCSLALAELLEGLGKQVIVLSKKGVPHSLGFLPGKEKVMAFLAEDTFPSQMLVVLDSSNLERAALKREAFPELKQIINIDHHQSNEFFGDINLVDAKASSVGEMVYPLIKLIQPDISRSMASNLFVSISSDTGSFRYSNTTPCSLRIASELIEYGADPEYLGRMLYESKRLEKVRITGYAAVGLRLAENGRITYSIITQQDINSFGCKWEDTDEIINMLTEVQGSEVAVLFREGKDFGIRVSLRSRNHINVAEIASRFGGGGHAKAAGVRMPAGVTLDETVTDILGALRDELKA